jgi:hypothetical protein
MIGRVLRRQRLRPKLQRQSLRRNGNALYDRCFGISWNLSPERFVVSESGPAVRAWGTITLAQDTPQR